MKKYIRFTLVPLILIGLASSNAHAGDDEALAAIGGFFAGVITGAIIDDHNDRDRVHVSVHRSYRDHDRHYDRHKRDYRGYGHKSKHHRSGHWETRRVRVWVPGYWDFEITRCGDRVKVWRRGHYEWRRERVWVAHRDQGRHHGRCG
jgi:hypothetical protein